MNREFEFETRTGSVSSFRGGVLTIKLTNGKLVSGLVKPSTRIECFSSSASTVATNERGDRGDRSDDRGQNRGDDHRDQADDRGQNRGNDNRDQGDDRGNDNGLTHVSCAASPLKPGRTIRQAELHASVWTEVELIVGA